MAADRITLRANDALLALGALRRSIQQDDETLSRWEPCDSRDRIVAFRDEQFSAYQRIAKALGLKPTLNPPEPKPCPR